MGLGRRELCKVDSEHSGIALGEVVPLRTNILDEEGPNAPSFVVDWCRFERIELVAIVV